MLLHRYFMSNYLCSTTIKLIIKEIFDILKQWNSWKYENENSSFSMFAKFFELSNIPYPLIRTHDL